MESVFDNNLLILDNKIFLFTYLESEQIQIIFDEIVIIIYSFWSILF